MAQPNPHNTYLPGYKEVGHHEWRTAENSAPYLLPTLQSLAETNPSLTLLDVGAGSGTITTSLAKYIPQGHITAIDLSPDILSRAASHAASVNATNITFQPASVYELAQTFGPAAFDVVHAHQVLCHLDAPVQALAQMLAVVKPGGVVAVREIDMRVWSFHPFSETMRAWVEVQKATHAAAGGSNEAGPSLVAWAMRAGARREDVKASMGTWLYATEEERRVWGTSFRDRIVGGEMRKKALELGIATEAELDRMGEEWQRWMETEDACCGTLHGEILIRKPK
ncbi:hypothetical protein WHR41_02844 [Cladosporium halotolerans]|uniref:Methyltransferase domain-containing protein n=1 Tax=Cladosporium halotolerans TaxID=1052096 RepID=A0AB34KY61_9PEZI